jgi:hypothetical protein
MDISLAGASLEVAAKPGGRRLELVIEGDEYSASLPAHLVHFVPAGEGVLLHLAFDALTPAQQAFLRQLLGGLRTLRPVP